MVQETVGSPEFSWREFDWLMSGIDIDQPKALKKE